MIGRYGPYQEEMRREAFIDNGDQHDFGEEALSLMMKTKCCCKDLDVTSISLVTLVLR